MSEFTITRQIGIDAGHRIPDHHSKCRSVHGHRYEIYATVSGQIATSGSTAGMAGGMDFGFIKDEMMTEIDAPYDHALILFYQDPLVELINRYAAATTIYLAERTWTLRTWTLKDAAQFTDAPPFGKVTVIGTIPTAENLAAHWYHRLYERINERSNGAARLVEVTVYETPNCHATYRG